MYDLTDHLPNFVLIEKFSSLSSNVKMCRRDYSAFNESNLFDDFQQIDWQTVLQANICNDPSEIIDKHLPVKELSKKEFKSKSKPWTTKAIRKLLILKIILIRNT